jgi:hypothetical protein
MEENKIIRKDMQPKVIKNSSVVFIPNLEVN